MPMRLPLLTLILACLCFTARGEEKTSGKFDRAAIRKFVEQLGSQDLATRQDAIRELSNLGEAPEELRQALKSADPEVRNGAQKAVDFITTRAELKAFKALVRWTQTKDFQSNEPYDPLVVQGKVIMGTDRGQLRAFQCENGDPVWSLENRARIFHTPCSDGQRVYFSSDRGLTAVKVEDGTEVWRFGVVSCDGPCLALARQGMVIVAGNDGVLYCVDAQTGKQVWTSDFLADAPRNPPGFSGKLARISDTKARPTALSSDGEALFLSVFDQCRIVAVRATDGKRLWSFQSGGWMYGSAIATERHVFVGSQDKFFYCLDKRTGKKVWSHETKGDVESGGAVDNEFVYFGSCDGRVYCLNQADGHERWRFATERRAIYSVPILQKGNVFFAAADGQAYAVDQQTGKLKWKVRPSKGSELYCSPATDGIRFFVVTRPSRRAHGVASLVAIGFE